MGSDDFMGTISLGVPEKTLKPETITDEWHQVSCPWDVDTDSIHPSIPSFAIISSNAIIYIHYIIIVPLYKAENQTRQGKEAVCIWKDPSFMLLHLYASK